MRFRSLSFIVLLLQWNWCDADDVDNQAEASSYVSGYIANFEAIESFDVLWKYESQWVSENGLVEDRVSVGRLVLDQKNSRCCHILDRSHTKLVKSKEGAIDKRFVALSGVVCDGDQAWSREIPNKPNRERPDVNVLLHYNNCVYMHSIGLVEFPVMFSQEDQFREHIDQLRHGVSVELRGGTPDTQAVRYRLPVKGDFDVMRSITFDRNSLTPVNFRDSLVRKEGKRKGEVIVRVRERYQFDEKDGLFFPREILGERRKSVKVDGKSTPGMEVSSDN